MDTVVLSNSATLCLLVGIFKPFTFQVTIDRYVFVAILFFNYFPLFFSHFLLFFLKQALEHLLQYCFGLTDSFSFSSLFPFDFK